MSVCFVVVPVVIGSWPMISAAIVAAGAAMGYQAVRQQEQALEAMTTDEQEAIARSVQLVMEDSEVVADTLMRGESFTLQNGDITATFHIDGRGACNVHMNGKGKTDAQLEEAGRELMDRVRQQFAYAKVMQEMEERGFQVVKQEVEENNSIRISVRRT
jgi:hypothetical protein